MTTGRLRIVSADVIEGGGEIPRREDGDTSVANAHGDWKARRGLLLRLEDDAGRVGFGEASPLPRYSPDDLDRVARAFDARPWSVLEADGADLSRPFHEAVAPVLAEPALDEAPAARFAVETALLDLAGQGMGQPAWALLLPKHAPPPGWPVAALLPASLSPEDLVDAGLAAVAAGHRTLKVKIGRPSGFDDELLALQSLRMRLGDDVALRVDANGTLLAGHATDRDQLLQRRLAALSEVDPELVEEPVAVESLLLTSSSPVPLGLDETLQRPDAARLLERALERGLCRAVVLKPMAIGGLDRCLALGRIAHAAGAAAIASHLLDGPVGFAATAVLAFVLAAERRGADRPAAGLGAHPGLEAWGVPRGAAPGLFGAEIRPTITPGLGVDGAEVWAAASSVEGVPPAAETASGRAADLVDAT